MVSSQKCVAFCVAALAVTLAGCSSGPPSPAADLGPGDSGVCEGPDADGDGVPDACDVCAGGDDHRDVNDNGTPDACECIGAMCTCADAANPVTYYLDTLTIPTRTQAMMGQTVGYDLDGVDDGCGLPDYPGQVDNAFIEVAEALADDPSPSGRIDFQALIDGGLCLQQGQPGIDLAFQVATGAGCATIDIYSGGTGGTPMASFVATHTGGVLRGAFDAMSLVIPFEASPTMDAALDLGRVEFTASIGTDGLTDILLGGLVAFADFLQFGAIFLASHECQGQCGSNAMQWCSVACVLDGATAANIMDVAGSRTNGGCGSEGSFSVGLFATAGTSPISAVCEPVAP